MTAFTVSSQPPAMAGEPHRSIRTRDLRLDIVRGLAMLCIYVDHAPGNALAAVTLKAFGLCDASEVFVLVSGMAAALAYSGQFRRDRAGAAWRVLRRIRSIYVAQIAVTAGAISALLTAAWWFDNPAYFAHTTLSMLPGEMPLAAVGLVTLTLQPGYLHILPLYVILMLTLPAILRLQLYHPLLPIVISVAVWLAAQVGFGLPAINEPTGWYFNPFAWQLLFTIGVVAGASRPAGEPWSRVWLIAAFAYLALGLLIAAPWKLIPALAEISIVDPSLIARPHKQSLPLLRLLHILALAYVAASLVPKDAAWLQTALPQAVALIGRNGLLVFSIATILDEWLLIWRLQGGRGVGYQMAVNIGGIAFLWACARLAESSQGHGIRSTSAIRSLALSMPTKYAQGRPLK